MDTRCTAVNDSFIRFDGFDFFWKSLACINCTAGVTLTSHTREKGGGQNMYELLYKCHLSAISGSSFRNVIKNAPLNGVKGQEWFSENPFFLAGDFWTIFIMTFQVNSYGSISTMQTLDTH